MTATSIYTLILSIVFIGKQIMVYRFKKAKSVSQIVN